MDGPYREIEALRERLSRLSAASRRINESLDFGQVLQGVLDSARLSDWCPLRGDDPAGRCGPNRGLSVVGSDC